MLMMLIVALFAVVTLAPLLFFAVLAARFWLEERRDREDVFVSPTAARHGLGVPVEHTMLVREDES
jgi:hypothetical protein